MDWRQVVAKIGLVDFFAKIDTRTAKTNTEGARQCRLRVSGIWAQVIRVIAPGDAQGAGRIETERRGRDDDKASGQARRNKVRYVVQARGKFAKVKISLGAVADHGIQSADGLVGHGQRNAAEEKIKERRDNPVASALR